MGIGGQSTDASSIPKKRESNPTNELRLTSLLNRASNLGKHGIRVRTDQANRSNNNHQNYGQHYGVFGDVLSRLI